MSRVGIVDCGMGNLHSVMRALKHAQPDADVLVCTQAHHINQVDRLILPGQGAMPDAMRQLHASGLYESLLVALRSKPVLGICIGEQILFDHSQEGDVDGLGVFKGEVKRFSGPCFDGEHRLKIPQMGWNQVHQIQAHRLWSGIPDHSFFYFVHSYYVEPLNDQLVVGKTCHGLDFASVVAQDNIFAVQFHAEKSSHQGLQMFRNFVSWKP